MSQAMPHDKAMPCLTIRPDTSADGSCENTDVRCHIMYSRRFLSTTTAYKTVAGLLLSILQLSNFNESKPCIVVNNTSLSPCQSSYFLEVKVRLS